MPRSLPHSHSPAPPVDAANITPGVVPEGYTTITEGSARILQRGNEVFYNPVQVRERKEKGKGDAFLSCGIVSCVSQGRELHMHWRTWGKGLQEEEARGRGRGCARRDLAAPGAATPALALTIRLSFRV